MWYNIIYCDKIKKSPKSCYVFALTTKLNERFRNAVLNEKLLRFTPAQTSNSCSDYLVIHSTKYQDVTYPSTRLVKANTLRPSLVRLVEIAPRCLLVDAVHHHRFQCLMHRLHELWERRSCSCQSIRPLIDWKGLLSVGNNDHSFDRQTADACLWRSIFFFSNQQT